MNILLIYPACPDTFWGFRHAVDFISKKAVHPPLGILTVAAMLPGEWKKKVVDMNVSRLKDKDVDWADMVFISAMAVQKKSAQKVIARCKHKGKVIVAGGPLFTAAPDDFMDVDHLVLNEAEATLPQFLQDLREGQPRRVYRSETFPEMEKAPVPMWELLDMKKYLSMDIQYSRGCPFDCDFCDITTLFGRNVRTKNKWQLLTELEQLYFTGWRGNVFLVDDNFIGNKGKLKNDVLPAMIDWQKKRKTPFVFSTEVSVNVADDEDLMRMMVEAGFETVFVGIETPEEESLEGCNKKQNTRRNLVESVKKLQAFGLEVTGGFIVGFDNDSPSIFSKQIEFIKNSGIITAMVGLLNAPRNSKLYKRLKSENRLIQDCTGNNTDFSINFIPKMDMSRLLEGYQTILKEIYSYKPYYERVTAFLKAKKIEAKRRLRFRPTYIKAFFQSMVVLGIKDRGRLYFWKLFFWSLFTRPRVFPLAITYAIYGFHFRKVFNI